MRDIKFNLIYCPECGAEYLPAEIYLPNELLGKPRNIMKDFQGRLIEFTGNSMNTRETFICDKCNTKFKISAKVNFRTEKFEKESFNKDHITKIPRKINLFED